MKTRVKLIIGSLLFAILLLIGIYCYIFLQLVDSVERNEDVQVHCVIITVFLCFLMMSCCCFLSTDYYHYRLQIENHSRLNIIYFIGMLLVFICCVTSIELLDPHIITSFKIYWVVSLISLLVVVLFVCHLQFSINNEIIIKNKSESTKRRYYQDEDMYSGYTFNESEDPRYSNNYYSPESSGYSWSSRISSQQSNAPSSLSSASSIQAPSIFATPIPTPTPTPTTTTTTIPTTIPTTNSTATTTLKITPTPTTTTTTIPTTTPTTTTTTIPTATTNLTATPTPTTQQQYSILT